MYFFPGFVKVRMHEPKEGINPPEDHETSTNSEIQVKCEA